METTLRRLVGTAGRRRQLLLDSQRALVALHQHTAGGDISGPQASEIVRGQGVASVKGVIGFLRHAELLERVSIAPTPPYQRTYRFSAIARQVVAGTVSIFEADVQRCHGIRHSPVRVATHTFKSTTRDMRSVDPDMRRILTDTLKGMHAVAQNRHIPADIAGGVMAEAIGKQTLDSEALAAISKILCRIKALERVVAGGGPPDSNCRGYVLTEKGEAIATGRVRLVLSKWFEQGGQGQSGEATYQLELPGTEEWDTEAVEPEPAPANNGGKNVETTVTSSVVAEVSPTSPEVITLEKLLEDYRVAVDSESCSVFYISGAQESVDSACEAALAAQKELCAKWGDCGEVWQQWWNDDPAKVTFSTTFAPTLEKTTDLLLKMAAALKTLDSHFEKYNVAYREAAEIKARILGRQGK